MGPDFRRKDLEVLKSRWGFLCPNSLLRRGVVRVTSVSMVLLTTDRGEVTPESRIPDETQARVLSGLVRTTRNNVGGEA